MAERSAARTASSRSSAAAGVPTLTTRILWVLGAVAWLFVAASLASFDTADPPSHVVSVHAQPIGNLCGRAGALIAYNAWYLLGIGSWILLIGVGIAIGAGLSGRRITHPLVRGLGMLIVAVAGASLHGLIAPTWGPLAGAEPGLAAVATVGELTLRFGGLGTFLLIAAAMLVGLLLAEEQIILHLPRLAIRSFRAAHRVTVPQITNLMTRPETPLKEAGTARGAAKARGRWTSSRSAAAAAAIDPDAGGLGAVESFDPDDHEIDETDEVDEAPKSKRTKKAARPVVVDEDEYKDDDDEDEEYEEEEEDEAEAEAASRALSAAELKAKIAKLPVRMASRQVTVAKDEDIPRHESFEGYQFPGLDLLEEPESNYSAKMEDYVRQQAEVLETSLQTYGIDGEVAGIESGPVVTLYSVQLAPGTKVAKVQAIASDVARSLRAQNIRIVPNMVGKTTVGIEVPNLHKEKVRLKELMSGGHSSGMHLPMFLGKDAAGEPLVADLTRMPHMLIAGTTGSGKSVCMNTIIMSWLYTKRPDELKLVLVDPKMVEMSQFSDVPHLMCPVVTEMSRAAAILEWAVTKMEERYELLKEAMVRDIASYNDLGEEELCERLQPSNELERAKIPKKLPYMVFIIDELADLIMTHKEVESSIVRIAQKARAVGIHLILATQRPQANVVTGLIKSNMPCRVSFRVASGMDSRIVLDQKGAELLLGQGDMMVLQPHSSEIMRAQGTLVTDLETRRVAKFLKSVAGPSFERTLLAIRPGGAGDADDRELDEDGLPLHERDPLFDKAVEIMIESGRGSVSLLQRRLAIGYTRASRLVDQMGRAGILSDHKGTVARDVVISMEDWERMKALEAAEAEGRGDDDLDDDDDDDDEHQTLDEADVDPLDDEDDDVEIETIDLDDDTPVGRRHADA